MKTFVFIFAVILVNFALTPSFASVQDLKETSNINQSDEDNENPGTNNLLPFDHDVAAYEIIAPESIVEPNVDIETCVSVCNLGEEAETFNVIFNIYDYDPDTLVYHTVKPGTHLTVESGLHELTFSYWTPGDSGRHYVAELIVSCASDQNPDNDTLIKHVWSGAAVAEAPTTKGFDLKIDGQTILFSVPYQARAEIAVFDVSGSKVRTLTDKIYPQGTHNLTWDGRDVRGNKVSQGIFLVRMEARGFEATRKVIIVN
ncbi:hypothetical protein JXM67_04240 [candidate division WOR-3 bacterium]|nr:hypothetical protein [candidate division WOR-3 bacterium]